MKSKMILTIGLLAIVVGIATTGIAIKSVQANVPGPGGTVIITPEPAAFKKAPVRPGQKHHFTEDGQLCKPGRRRL